jgi:hypothetical protein
MTIKQYMTVRALFKLYGENSKKVTTELLKINKHLKLKEANKILLSYLDGLNSKKEEVTQRFTFDGIEYGLIPDFEDLMTSEYVDIDLYENDFDNVHRLMAILYRPVISSYGKLYEIEEYQGSKKYADVMLEVDVKIYHSVIAFFLTLNEILLKDIHESMTKKSKRKKLKKDL